MEEHGLLLIADVMVLTQFFNCDQTGLHFKACVKLKLCFETDMLAAPASKPGQKGETGGPF